MLLMTYPDSSGIESHEDQMQQEASQEAYCKTEISRSEVRGFGARQLWRDQLLGCSVRTRWEQQMYNRLGRIRCSAPRKLRHMFQTEGEYTDTASVLSYPESHLTCSCSWCLRHQVASKYLSLSAERDLDTAGHCFNCSHWEHHGAPMQHNLLC